MCADCSDHVQFDVARKLVSPYGVTPDSDDAPSFPSPKKANDLTGNLEGLNTIMGLMDMKGEGATAFRSDIIFLKNDSSILRQSSNLVCDSVMVEPSQFSVGKTAKSLTCFIMEKPHTGLDDCLNMLLASFRKRMSASGRASSAGTSSRRRRGRRSTRPTRLPRRRRSSRCWSSSTLGCSSIYGKESLENNHLICHLT